MRAVARPMPDEAPVMTMTCSAMGFNLGDMRPPLVLLRLVMFPGAWGRWTGRYAVPSSALAGRSR